MNTKLKNWSEIVTEGLREFDIAPDYGQVESLLFHSSEMLKWNKTTNLTSITDPVEIAVKHIIDSVILSKYCTGFEKVLDIGTGAGFPGVPLKIMRPDTEVTLVETIRKKVSFLKHVIRSLKMDNITAIQARGEELSKESDYGGKYDAVVCRAFSGIDTFMNMAIPFLKEGGTVLAMKGREKKHEEALLKNVDAELFNGKRVSVSDFSVTVEEYKLPVIVSDRVMFIIKLGE